MKHGGTFICLVILISVCGQAYGNGPERRYRPVIAGRWRVLYKPVKGASMVNDHSVFRDADGNWRFVGITHRRFPKLLNPHLGHAVGKSLDKPMRELPKLFSSYPDRRPKWAPHVVVHEGTWHMFVGPGRIRHYVSQNGANWKFHDIAVRPGWFSFRDTMVLEIGETKWFMYGTDRHNTISVYKSSDLYKWERVGTVFRAVKPAAVYPKWLPFGGISATESPFVIRYKGAYYLSVCLTSAFKPYSYGQTIVVRSTDPTDFGTYAAGGRRNTADLVAILPAHAAEYIHTPDDKWYITSCGWNPVMGAEGLIPGSVVIAPLKWVPLEPPRSQPAIPQE